MSAATLAHLSARIYEKPAIFRADARAMGYPNSLTFDQASMQAGLVWNDDEAVVVFRGTEGADLVWADFWASIRLAPYAWSGQGRVHEGYRAGMNSLWPRLRPHLQQLDVPVTATGHSLGGALATMCAAKMQVATDVDDAVLLVTFGCPKVGDAEFVAWLKTPHRRHVNGMDPVPLFPPTWSYRQHGREIKHWSGWHMPLGYHDIAKYEKAVRGPLSGYSILTVPKL